jgi:cytochrome c oxidase cbb3-type subunit I/II
VEDLLAQAQEISDNLKKDGIEVVPNTEIVALIAYLQRLGTDIKVKDAQAAMVTE